jgi:chromosome segregation ATPase
MLSLQSQQKQTEQQLAELQTRLESLETGQSQHAESLTDLDQRVSGIETEIEARTKSLSELEKLQTQLAAQNEATSAELDRQINLLKAMELLSRGRLFMYQSNFGLAKQDIRIAHDLLVEIQPDAPESLATELDAVVRRLELALSNLPSFPVVASDDLDIAWQILLSGLPPTPAMTVTSPVLQLTPSMTPIATFTSTPQATPTRAP